MLTLPKISTSTTSALPQRLDTLRLPCLATRAPAAAAMTVAPVRDVDRADAVPAGPHDVKHCATRADG